MAEKILSYEEAYRELTSISEEIQNESVSVDVLAQKRASELITYCQGRLRSTETEVNKIIAQMEQKTRE